MTLSKSAVTTADCTGQVLQLVLCRQGSVNSCLFSPPNVLLVLSVRVQTAVAITMAPSDQSSHVTRTVYTTGTGRWGKEGPTKNITSNLKTSANGFLTVPKPGGTKSTTRFFYSRSTSLGCRPQTLYSCHPESRKHDPPTQSRWCCKTAP